MYRIDNESLNWIQRHQHHIDLMEARRRFLVTLDARGDEQNDRDSAGFGSGLFHPIIHWDVVPPLAAYKQRIVRHGVPTIVSLVKGTAEERGLTDLPEGAWVALEGGRVMVASPVDGSLFEQRKVENGQLDNGALLGTDLDPIRIRNCFFDRCIFFHCTFRHVHFGACRFPRCTFIQCTFDSCIFTACDFQRTIWGDQRHFTRPRKYPDLRLYNRFNDCRTEGRTRSDDATGFGPAAFMNTDEINARTEEVVAALAKRQADPTTSIELPVWKDSTRSA